MNAPADRHIMMTTDTVGGVWVYATLLARVLGHQGDRVTLVTLGPPPNAAQRDVIGRIEGKVDLVVTDLALEWIDPAGHDRRRAADALLALARDLRPDIVHLNGFREGAIAWPAPVLVVAHSCVLSWWQACRGGLPDEPRWRAYAQAVAAGLRAADVWVAPTAAFRDTVTRLYAPAAEGVLIHNGIDHASSCADSRRDVILASGRVWDCAKGHGALLSAAPQVPWQIEIAGATSGPNGESAQQDDGGPGDNVRLLGEISRHRLLQRMSDAAIYVAPARYEPFGLGVLEAASSGCALVLSDIPSFRELWEGAAIFVQADEPEALAAALQLLCADPKRRSTLQLAARERAKGYSIATTAGQYCALYDSLLGREALAVGREARA